MTADDHPTAGPQRPLRLVQVGLGAMGRTWLDAIDRHPGAELVGVVDLDARLASRTADDHGLDAAAAGSDLANLDVGADAAVNVTVPRAHLAVCATALQAGLPVLCEKPAAPTVAEALRMAATSRATGNLLVVSQSRRFLRGVAAMRRALPDLGMITTVSCDFHRAPHFGGFREQMDHPLLVDMAIHHFDLARLLVGTAPVAVDARSTNPSWSWFAGDAVADAQFTFADGARFDYSGSWVAQGAESPWNGTWTINAEHGTLTWDGQGAPVLTASEGPPVTLALADEPEEVDGSLDAFLARLRDLHVAAADVDGSPTDAIPHSDIDDNVASLAMVAAAVASADSGRTTSIPDLLDDAHRTARATEPDPTIRAHLTD